MAWKYSICEAVMNRSGRQAGTFGCFSSVFSFATYLSFTDFTPQASLGFWTGRSFHIFRRIWELQHYGNTISSSKKPSFFNFRMYKITVYKIDCQWRINLNKTEWKQRRKSFISGLCYYRFDYRFADLEIGHSLCSVYLGMAAALAKQSCLIYLIF